MEVALIILGIAALIGGYFFLKTYRKMDAALFGDVEGYNASGVYIVYASAIIGAIFGCIFMYSQISNKHADTEIFSIFVYILMSLILCTSIYQSILAFDNVSTVIRKSLWLLFSCVLAAVIGAAGSVVIICIIILYLVIAVLGGMIFGSGKKTKIREEDGTEHTVQDMGMFGNIDESGNTWTNKGFGEYEKDN